jgi:two-component system, NarL family, response regulator LiaR
MNEPLFVCLIYLLERQAGTDLYLMKQVFIPAYQIVYNPIKGFNKRPFLSGVYFSLGEKMEKIRIVIADDHAVVREGTRALLEKEEDMEVVGEASDGEEAVKLIERLKPDIAILDVSMPKLSGIEVTRQVKTILPSLGILILSAYDNDEYVFALLEAGAAGYLLKDGPGKEIAESVRTVYSGESVLHPSIARKVIQRALSGAAKTVSGKMETDLSDREIEVLKLAAKGMTNRDIADSLCISIRTVQGHVNSIFHKLNVGSRTEAVFQSIKKGLLSFDDIA